MTQEEKELLLQDLSARLSPGIIIYRITDNSTHRIQYSDILENIDQFSHFLEYSGIENIKPYLRPLSSITDEEKIELYKIAGFYYISNNELLKDEWRQFSGAFSENKLFLPYPIWGDDLDKVYNWLNFHYFDYRGLIPMGLALPALEGMY